MIDGTEPETHARAMFEIVSPSEWLGPMQDVPGPQAMVLLLGALVLDACIGEPAWLARVVPNPTSLVTDIVRRLEPRLNRTGRPPLDRLVRGVLLIVCLSVAAVALGAVLTWGAQRLPFGWGLELGGVWLLLDVRGPWDRARRRATGANGGTGVAAWPFAPAESPGPPADRTIARGLAVALAEGFAGGVFWYLLAGLPGLSGYRVIVLCGHLLEMPSPRYDQFGLAARGASEALSLLPAFLVGSVLCPAALFVPGGRPAGVVDGLRRWRTGPGSRARLAAVAAFRGGLGLAPSGGGAAGEAGRADLRRGLYLYVVTWLIGVALLAALAMVRLAA